MQVLKETILSKYSTTMDMVAEILNVREDLLIEELGNKALINELIEVCLKIEHWHDKIEQEILSGVVWNGHYERWYLHWLQKFDRLYPQIESLLSSWPKSP